MQDAVGLLPDANIALISVAGPYAAIEAHKALSLRLTPCCSATTCR